jgi:hypothetical protein
VSHLRVLICRVDDADEQMTELASLDLPAVPARWAAAPLDAVEASVARAGQDLLARLCEFRWDAVDAQAVSAYCAAAPLGSVWADGHATLTVASRFGTLQLRRQVCAHRDGRPHVMPGNSLLPTHHGLLITRGLAEHACVLAQEVPFATAARLLGWHVGESGVLSATTLRALVRDHGRRLRRLEHGEALGVLHAQQRGRRLRGVAVGEPRRRPGWPAELRAAVDAALAQARIRPPEGVSWADWERVRAAWAAEPAATATDLQRLGPRVAPGQFLLILDEVLAPAPGRGHFHELRTACLLTAQSRRYLSGTGDAFLLQVLAAVRSCLEQSLLVVADGASWIRTFFRDDLAHLPGAQMVLDWHHLAKKCRDLAARICPSRPERARLLHRLFRWLWAGQVPRAVRVLERQWSRAADPQAVDGLIAYLQAREEWIPNYRARRRQRLYNGNGLGEKANDRLVARRQKRKGMQWGAQTSDALAALRTLLLNEQWDDCWLKRQRPSLHAA